MSGLVQRGGRFLKKSDTKCTCRGRDGRKKERGEEVSTGHSGEYFLEYKHVRDAEEVKGWAGNCDYICLDRSVHSC